VKSDPILNLAQVVPETEAEGPGRRLHGEVTVNGFPAPAVKGLWKGWRPNPGAHRPEPAV
jgi:hypothetical protein